MMKKIYNQPTCIVVALGSRDALLQSVSTGGTLSNTRFGGTTSDNIVTTADVKGTNDVNLWDNEW